MVIEEQLRLIELGAVGAVLEIQVDGGRIAQPLAGQGRLAALTRSEQGERRRAGEPALQRLLGKTRNITMHFDYCALRFAWFDDTPTTLSIGSSG